MALVAKNDPLLRNEAAGSFVMDLRRESGWVEGGNAILCLLPDFGHELKFGDEQYFGKLELVLHSFLSLSGGGAMACRDFQDTLEVPTTKSPLAILKSPLSVFSASPRSGNID